MRKGKIITIVIVSIIYCYGSYYYCQRLLIHSILYGLLLYSIRSGIACTERPSTPLANGPPPIVKEGIPRSFEERVLQNKEKSTDAAAMPTKLCIFISWL